MKFEFLVIPGADEALYVMGDARLTGGGNGGYEWCSERMARNQKSRMCFSFGHRRLPGRLGICGNGQEGAMPDGGPHAARGGTTTRTIMKRQSGCSEQRQDF
jgi:hypothetical protein